MSDRPWIEITGGALTAAINPHGAELSSLKDADGRELMTDADPAFWTGRAPLLFPIVGALAGGVYRVDGAEYPLPQHGFARHSDFELIDHAPDRALFRLTDSAATRALYPFAFALDAAFALDDAGLSMEVTVANRGDRDMPASFGFHPAFAWPLPYGAARGDHRIVFDADEPGPIARIEQALIGPENKPSPVVDRTIALDDALFARDAMVWEHIHSDGLTYGAAGAPRLRIDFPGAPMLGIWTKPGAHYVCVEPWWGIADPLGFAGTIWEKPGIMRFAPGEARTFTMRVTPQS